eukprot:gnl/TRDRNA2_/TRDRNA2_59808_c0_seq1.p1 gnl/TRDRNA2_/TRDRNA2_59808_c0~~gnl/TRDRNA2_/TRDRNA2_59808_c0_seq1.p1  ORF type:complete len:251 (-),score=60.83 gnl/TRDRNA2_/TRDRNA2_59808_c0_seq1:16-768(-)
MPAKKRLSTPPPKGLRRNSNKCNNDDDESDADSSDSTEAGTAGAADASPAAPDELRSSTVKPPSSAPPPVASSLEDPTYSELLNDLEGDEGDYSLLEDSKETLESFEGQLMDSEAEAGTKEKTAEKCEEQRRSKAASSEKQSTFQELWRKTGEEHVREISVLSKMLDDTRAELSDLRRKLDIARVRESAQEQERGSRGAALRGSSFARHTICLKRTNTEPLSNMTEDLFNTVAGQMGTRLRALGIGHRRR